MSEAIQTFRQFPYRGYPRGARAMLRSEARVFRSSEALLVAGLEARGYEEVILPVIDYADPYAAVEGHAARKAAYRFVDPAGELVTLRSDFTPMVARALAPTVMTEQLPLRVFYRGEVVRNDARQIGAGRVFHQVGAEIVGDDSIDADVEVVALAVDLARSAGAKPRLVLQDHELTPALLRGCDLTVTDEQALRSALSSRDTARVESLVSRLDSKRSETLRRVLRGTAVAMDFRQFPETADSSARLEAITCGARQLDAGAVLLSIDIEEESSSYYTGFRFRLHDPRSRQPIVEGGRYDRLYSCFGTGIPAAGLTLTLDALPGTGRCV